VTENRECCSVINLLRTGSRGFAGLGIALGIAGAGMLVVGYRSAVEPPVIAAMASFALQIAD
jgi:hypothetical protein